MLFSERLELAKKIDEFIKVNNIKPDTFGIVSVLQIWEMLAIPIKPPVKPACERDIRIDELNKLQQTLNPYQMNENDFFRAMMNGTIKNTILTRINQLSKSV